MENVGALALLLAFCISLYAIVASVAGRLKNKPFLILSGERAVLAVWLLISTAAGILIYSLMTGDMRMAYVASHTNRAMPVFYKFSAWWGGQEEFAALLELDSLHLRCRRGAHQPRQTSPADAVGCIDSLLRPDLLPYAQRICRQSVPGARPR